MRKFVLFSVMTLSLIVVKAQITTREISTAAAVKPKLYDSINGFDKASDPRIYTGQTIYMLSKGCGDCSRETYDFLSGINPPSIYHPIISQKAKYSYEQNAYCSDYNAVSQKYFVILDVIDKTNENKGFYFKLLSKEFGDTAYLYLGTSIGRTRLLYGIIVGCFEKKKQLIGQKLQSWKDFNAVDINTGENVSYKADSWLTCVDVTITKQQSNYATGEQFDDYYPAIILKNSSGKEIAVNYESDLFYTFKTEGQINEQKKLEQEAEKERIDRERKEQETIAKNETEFKRQCISKYGQKLGTMIYNKEVSIGMTAEMCSMAWGDPSYINETIVKNGKHQQWVYSMGNYLYLDNGILTAIQKRD